jgi:hypothetical protein
MTDKKDVKTGKTYLANLQGSNPTTRGYLFFAINCTIHLI